MSIQIAGALVLLAVFVVGTLTKVNLGALALVGSFALGLWLAHEDLNTLLSGFPADLFLVLFGVTYLFGIATSNGTIDWVVTAATRAVGTRRGAIPVVIFVLSAVPTAIGAAGPAAVALLAPTAARIAERNGISPVLAGLLVVHGTTAGAFSPVNPAAVIVTATMQRNGLTVDPGLLFLGNFLYNAVLGLILLLIFRKRRASGDHTGSGTPAAAADESRRDPAPTAGDAEVPAGSGRVVAAPAQVAREGERRTPVIGATLVAFGLVAAGAIVLKLDVGVLATVLAVALHLAFPGSSATAMRKVSWDVILLICGILTLVATLRRIGTVEMVGHAIAKLESPLLGALLILLLAALVSSVASSTGTLGAVIPLSLPLLAGGAISTPGFAVALSASVTVVDASPFSTNGALVLAGLPEASRPRAFRLLLVWGAAMVVTAPVVTWAVFVLLAYDV
ncbi:SLC13 family permease [Pseudonocardia eucalypti]|uniref:SLC13 family permease n=1 Tax=Pseudonocardia eucalypti TaxID=648755 RepID=A0ABP9QJX0_9PSEU|nr:Na+/H+ antiporter NhaD/arsenite permease-like protein [Pseudonocardia eucalypti]